MLLLLINVIVVDQCYCCFLTGHNIAQNDNALFTDDIDDKEIEGVSVSVDGRHCLVMV